jgi:hypothetical protein
MTTPTADKPIVATVLDRICARTGGTYTVSQPQEGTLRRITITLPDGDVFGGTGKTIHEALVIVADKLVRFGALPKESN